MSSYPYNPNNIEGLPHVVVVGLASCYGCQIQITNDESHLLDILSQFDLQYWQLTSNGEMSESYDIAVIEGAVTTKESVEMVKRIRHEAKVVITIGACAATGGIPGIAAGSFKGRAEEVYDEIPAICGELVTPCAVSEVIDVDFAVLGCPIEPVEFIKALGQVLYGSNYAVSTRTLCGDCKCNESNCFFENGTVCLGLVTTAGCNARCVSKGRPCKGCRGISSDANLESARQALSKYGVSQEAFDSALEIFNRTNPVLAGKE